MLVLVIVIVIGFHFFDDDYEHRFAEHEHEWEEREPGAGAMAAIRLRTFSLRTALILFLVTGTALGLFARWLQEIRERGAAHRRVVERSTTPQKATALILRIDVKTDEPTWLQRNVRKWIDPDYDRPFATVSLSGGSASDVEIARDIGKSNGVMELRLGSCAPEILTAIANSPRLETLSISSMRHDASDYRESTKPAKQFTSRTRRAMQQAFDSLASNPRFTTLFIRGELGLQPNDWTEFCRRSNLQSLNLQSPEMAPECVALIAKLPNLESLTIYDLALRGEHLAPLTGAKKLKSLLVGPNVSREEADALRKAMPQCKIERF